MFLVRNPQWNFVAGFGFSNGCWSAIKRDGATFSDPATFLKGYICDLMLSDLGNGMASLCALIPHQLKLLLGFLIKGRVHFLGMQSLIYINLLFA